MQARSQNSANKEEVSSSLLGTKEDHDTETGSSIIANLAANDPDKDYARKWSYPEITRKFARLASPYVAMRMLDIGSEITGGILFARLSDKYFAANALIIPMQRFLTATGTAFLFAMGPTLRGHKNNPILMGNVTQRGVVLALCISVPSMAIASCNEPLLKAFNIDPELAKIVQNFYYAALPSIPCILFQAALQQFTLAIEKPKISLFVNIINNAIIIGTGSVLTLGLFNAPQWKEIGFGASYSIAYGLTTMSLITYLTCHPIFKPYQLSHFRTHERHLLRQLFKLGFPLGIQVTADYVLRYALAIFVGLKGNNSLSAARMIEMVYILMLTTIIRGAQVTGNFTKDAFKAQNKQLIRRVSGVTMVTLSVLTLIWSAAAIGSNKSLLGVLSDHHDSEQNDDEIMKIAQQLLYIYPIGLFGEIVRYTLAGSLRGLDDTTSSMWNSIGLLNIIGIPTLYLAYHLGGNTSTLYATMNAVLGLAAGSMAIQWGKKVSNLFATENTSLFPQSTSVSYPKRLQQKIQSWCPTLFAKNYKSDETTTILAGRVQANRYT